MVGEGFETRSFICVSLIAHMGLQPRFFAALGQIKAAAEYKVIFWLYKI